MKKPVSVILVSLLVSCGKEAPEVDEAYVGFWKNADTDCHPSLNIEADGDGYHSSYFPNEECRYKGKDSGVARIRNGSLHIGRWEAKIDRSPTPIDPVDVPVDWEYGEGEYWSTMEMVLDGITYYKIQK